MGYEGTYGRSSALSITIPSAVSEINISGYYTIVCSPGSYAEQYAKDNSIVYSYDSTTESTDWLN